MEIEGIRIIRFEASLYYANVENFNYKVAKLSEIKVDEVTAAVKKAKVQYEENTRKIKARHQKIEKQAKKNALKAIDEDSAPTIATNVSLS